MAIVPGYTYHVFNQGNNRERLFYGDDDYRRFLLLTKKHIASKGSILAYCLMPNHFHFLIHATDESAKEKRVGNIYTTELANGFRLLQSIYAQIINKSRNRTGSLFRQKARFKEVISDSYNYGLTAFHYLHQNPRKANLTSKLEEWPFSSFNEYFGAGQKALCEIDLAIDILALDMSTFLADSYLMIDEQFARKTIF